jgi:hypothetical protein
MLGFIVLAAVWIGIEWALPPGVLPQALVYMLGLPVLSVAAVSGVRDLLGDRADS